MIQSLQSVITEEPEMLEQSNSLGKKSMTTTTYPYNPVTKSHKLYCLYVQMTHICEREGSVSDTLTVQVSWYSM